MKKITPSAAVVIIVCFSVILVAVYFIQTSKPGNATSISPPTTPSVTPTKTGSAQTPVPAGVVTTNESIKGPLSISLGDYNAKIPVLIDNTNVGEISRGKPLNVSVNEGYHAVKVCIGNVCEQVGVEVKSAIKTTIDFGERLKRDVPQGTLSVSLGDYKATMPVFVDDMNMGNVSTGKPLNLTLSQGRHTVRVCAGSVCQQQNLEITSTKQTLVDFGDQLRQSIRQGPLMVSLGSYVAELPVFVDNISVGNVSTAKPLNMMLNEGSHTVRVCVGLICENESVEVKFAQQLSVDFGERLKRDAEFTTPTVRILNHFMTGNRLTVDAEFINPGRTDLTMTVTIGVGYSFIDSTTRQRENEYGQYRFTRTVRAGNRTKQSLEMTLSGGSSPIASEPTIVEVQTA